MMLCGWNGIRRSGIALAMCHRLSNIRAPLAVGIYTPTEWLVLVEFICCSNHKTVVIKNYKNYGFQAINFFVVLIMQLIIIVVH